eukprot:XP_014781702.1 PREDICTED: uncharacterized protein LOC106877339 [Octopus bimaculoides]
MKCCHAKLMTTGSVKDTRSDHLTTSRSAENVATVQMSNRSLQKSTRQVTRESGLTRHTIRTVLRKELSFHPWKPHYAQELKPEDCNHRMEYGVLIGLNCLKASSGVTRLGCYNTDSTLEDLETRIQIFNDMPDDVLQKVVHSIPGRLRKLVEATSTYVEI